MDKTEIKAVVFFRCNDEQKKKLRDVALELGIGKVTINRNDLGLVVLRPRKESELSKCIKKAKKRGFLPQRPKRGLWNE